MLRIMLISMFDFQYNTYNICNVYNIHNIYITHTYIYIIHIYIYIYIYNHKTLISHHGCLYLLLYI